MGEAGGRPAVERRFDTPHITRSHRSVTVYKLTDGTTQLVKGRRETLPGEFRSAHDIQNRVIHASDSGEGIVINEFDEGQGHALYAIFGTLPCAACLPVFLVVPGETDPCLFIAPSDITISEITETVARNCSSISENLVLFFDGKRLETLTNVALEPLEMMQVVEEKPVPITLAIHERWQKEMTVEFPVPTTATSSDIVKLLRESDEEVEYDESKYTLCISAGFRRFGELDFPAIDLMDRKGRFIHQKMKTTNFVLHQVPKGEERECLRVQMLKNDDWVDTVIFLPQNSFVGDLRCELGRMMSCPGNSLRIAMGTRDDVLLLPHNVPLSEPLHRFRSSEEAAPILYVKPEADMKVTVEIESPKKMKMSKYHFYFRRYDPAALVYRGVAEERNCDPGLVRLCHQGKPLSDFASLCQCLQGNQDSCTLTAVILKEGTILRLLHKTGLCCKILVEDTTKSTVADMERLVEDIHSYSRGSVTVLKEGLPLDRGLTISEAGLKMQDAVLVTTCDQANAVTGVPPPFQCVFEAGQDGETHRRFAVRVNGISCYAPTGVSKADLAGYQEEDPICAEPVSGIHVLSRIRHEAHRDSSHAVSPKSCHHASEFHRRTSSDEPSSKEEEAASPATCQEPPTPRCADRKAKANKPSAKMSQGKFQWSNSICTKEEKYDEEVKDECDAPDATTTSADVSEEAVALAGGVSTTSADVSEVVVASPPELSTANAGVSEENVASARGMAVCVPKSGPQQQLVKEGFQLEATATSLQTPTVCIRKTVEIVAMCRPEQLPSVLNQVDAGSGPHLMEGNSPLPIAGSPREKDPLDTVLEGLAEDLGNSWGPVCRSLGLLEKDIEEIEAKHPRDLSRQALAGLMKWKQRSGKGANVSTLKCSLLRNGRVDLSESLSMEDKEEVTDTPP